MRHTHIFILIFTGLIAIFGLFLSDIYAACSSSWAGAGCPVSPYCAAGKCSVDAGVKAVETAVAGQITSK